MVNWRFGIFRLVRLDVLGSSEIRQDLYLSDGSLVDVVEVGQQSSFKALVITLVLRAVVSPLRLEI